MSVLGPEPVPLQPCIMIQGLYVPWYIENIKTNQNGTEQWSGHWNVHNFRRSTLISLHILVARRTLSAPHVHRFNYYYTHVLVLTFFDMFKTHWQAPGTADSVQGFTRRYRLTEIDFLDAPHRENTPRLLS